MAQSNQDRCFLKVFLTTCHASTGTFLAIPTPLTLPTFFPKTLKLQPEFQVCAGPVYVVSWFT
jgi:hypothetical protein